MKERKAGNIMYLLTCRLAACLAACLARDKGSKYWLFTPLKLIHRHR